MFANAKQAKEIIGSLGQTTKMPGKSWGISATLCNVGGKLRKVNNSVCQGCYALKGFYMFRSVKTGHDKRLALFNESLERDGGESWVAAMVYLLHKEKHFRFLDSGDLQSVEMLDCFIRVAKALPSCNFWIPTREYAIVGEWVAEHGALPDNVTIRLSSLIVDGPKPTGVAKRLGVVTSGVTTGEKFTCQAPKNNGKCLDCRSCWDKNVSHVTYRKH